jgi:peptidoglycan/LPS O-acetylase OafA/YrhL
MAAATTREPERFTYLDGLRGLAAIVVLLAHYVLAFQPAMYFGTVVNANASRFTGALWIAQTPLIALFSPQFGVAIFFVLSGFVLAASVSRKPAPLVELAVRRWIRLSGPALLTTLFIWLWLTSGWHPDLVLAAINHSDWLAMNFTWIAWQTNDLPLAAFQAVFDVYARNRHWWNTSLWTLQIELWGSLALFAVYIVTRRWPAPRSWRLLAAVMVGWLAWRSDYAGFAIGAALFEVQPDIARFANANRILAWVVGPLLLTAALLLGGAPIYGTVWSPYIPILSWLAAYTSDPIIALHRLGGALMVASVLVWIPLQRLLATRVVNYLGRVSFMLYLCHVSLICSLGAWLVLRLSPLVGYEVACLLALPIFMAVVLVVAGLGTHWLDAPCIRLAHRAGRGAASGWLRLTRPAPAMSS